MRSCLQSKQCKQYLFMFVYKVFNFIFSFFAEWMSLSFSFFDLQGYFIHKSKKHHSKFFVFSQQKLDQSEYLKTIIQIEWLLYQGIIISVREISEINWWGWQDKGGNIPPLSVLNAVLLSHRLWLLYQGIIISDRWEDKTNRDNIMHEFWTTEGDSMTVWGIGTMVEVFFKYSWIIFSFPSSMYLPLCLFFHWLYPSLNLDQENWRFLGRSPRIC